MQILSSTYLIKQTFLSPSFLNQSQKQNKQRNKSMGKMDPFLLSLQTQERKKAKHEYKLE